MDNNWPGEITNGGGRVKVNWVVVIFIVLQLMFVVAIVFSIVQIGDNSGMILDDVGFTEDDPQVKIDGIMAAVPGLTEEDAKVIQQKLFEVMSENNTELNTRETKAEIREGTVSDQYFEDLESGLLTMVVDVPELEQSYRILYEDPSGILDLDERAFVICLDKEEEVRYSNFHCKSSDSRITRRDVVTEYLPYFSFDGFTASVANDSNQIVISPFNEGLANKTKSEYVDLVKEKVRSLGASPNAFEYSLVEMDDMNYGTMYDDSE